MNEYRLIDNTDEFLEDFAGAIERGLIAVGMAAEGNAKDILTETVYSQVGIPWVLTGRLRNSITFATNTRKGKTLRRAKSESSRKDDAKAEANFAEEEVSNPEKKTVIIGTNVDYAQGIELGTHRKKGAVRYLQRAASEHNEEYKNLIAGSVSVLQSKYGD